MRATFARPSSAWRASRWSLQAKLEVRDAIAKGGTAIRTADRIVFVANGRGSVVEEFRLDELPALRHLIRLDSAGINKVEASSRDPTTDRRA